MTVNGPLWETLAQMGGLYYNGSEMGWECVNWIHLAQGRHSVGPLWTEKLTFLFHKKQGNFSIRWGSITFSRTLLHGVRKRVADLEKTTASVFRVQRFCIVLTTIYQTTHCHTSDKHNLWIETLHLSYSKQVTAWTQNPTRINPILGKAGIFEFWIVQSWVQYIPVLSWKSIW
jgi:hypothetical protein